MARTLVTGPLAEPLSVAEAKAQCRIDTTDEDARIRSFIISARRWIERTYGLALVNQTWDFTPEDYDGTELDGFPPADEGIRAPLYPLSSVTSVTYVDSDGASQVWASSNYVVQTGTIPGRVRLAYDASWPTARVQPNAVVVRAVFGYGAAATSVPENLRYAIALLVGNAFENREASIVGVPQKIKFGVDELVAADGIVEVS
jgi:uncharacterized phiE125 gp8 family phage protein